MSGRSAKRVKKSNNTTSEVLGDSRFGFLDLPPGKPKVKPGYTILTDSELRNWVYDYVAHDDDPNDRPPALHYYPDDGPRRIVKRAPLRQGFALTQTCRLIRYEYLPLYQAQARVSCSYQSLRACCIEKDDAGAQLVLPLGKTIVEYRMKSRVLDEDGRLKRPVYDTEETDLLALIRAAQRTPNLQLEFALAGIAPAGQIEVGHLFNLRGNPTWNKALDEQIERLRMLPESVHLIQTIAIEVKVEYTEDWMARQCK